VAVLKDSKTALDEWVKEMNGVSGNASALLDMTFTNPEEEVTALKNMIRSNKAKIRSISAKTRANRRIKNLVALVVCYLPAPSPAPVAVACGPFDDSA
jgi:hypothetical protein